LPRAAVPERIGACTIVCVSTWLVVWLVVGLVSTAALAAFGIWMVRHVTLLIRTMGRVQEELTPIAEEISRESARASERAASLRMPPRTGRRTDRR
jgi:fatty acid desaturase